MRKHPTPKAVKKQSKLEQLRQRAIAAIDDAPLWADAFNFGQELGLPEVEVAEILMTSWVAEAGGIEPVLLSALIDSGAWKNLLLGIAGKDVEPEDLAVAIDLFESIGMLRTGGGPSQREHQAINTARGRLASATVETLALTMHTAPSALHRFARDADQRPGPERLRRGAFFFRILSARFARTAEELAEAAKVAQPVKRGRPPKSAP